jgi:hypothetical protein
MCEVFLFLENIIKIKLEEKEQKQRSE